MFITLHKPVNVDGFDNFVGVTGIAPRSGTNVITVISPRISLYVKIGANPDFKIYPQMALPVIRTFQAGDDFRAMASDEMGVTFDLTFDP